MTATNLLQALTAAEDEDIRSAGSLLGYGEVNMKPHRHFPMIRTLLVAAVIAALLTVTAYAAGWIGLNPLIVEGSTSTYWQQQPNGVFQTVENPDGRQISVTRPTIIPDDLDESIRAKLEVSMAAWEEWNAGRDAEGRNAVTPSEVAAKYGLKDLGASEGTFLSWESFKAAYEKWGQSFDETIYQNNDHYMTNAELAAMVEELFCHDRLFSEVPVGFDKVYYFSEGDFCVSYYVLLPSDGTQVTCYAYDGRYDVFHTGYEVGGMEIDDIYQAAERTRVAPDGTKVSILRCGSQAYIYAFLDNSYLCEAVFGTESMTDADLDYIADFLCYSAIH